MCICNPSAKKEDTGWSLDLPASRNQWDILHQNWEGEGREGGSRGRWDTFHWYLPSSAYTRECTYIWAHPQIHAVYILYLEFLQLLPHFSTHLRAKLLWDLTEFLLYLFRFLPHFSSRLDDSSYRYIWGIKVPRPLMRFISTEPSATAYLFFLFYISWMWLIGLIIFTLFTIPLEAPQCAAGFHTMSMDWILLTNLLCQKSRSKCWEVTNQRKGGK